jgi:non-specific serine/threonine protein kinase
MGDPERRPSEIRRLFDLLVQLAPSARAEKLAEAGRDDPGLREELETLLDADTGRSEILEPLEQAFAPTPPPPLHDPWTGRSLPRYEIQERLGGGGMGVVYKARDRRLDRTVALKFLPPNILADADAQARFMNEARAASALDHPNICTIYEFDATPDGHPYIAMAYVPGRTLQEMIRQGPLPISQSIGLALQVALGLGRAHEGSVIHRDIKPANLMVTDRGELRILDFGVARRGGSTLTETGLALGTLAYMSPEQLQARPVDGRTDLWSLGVVLFEMLAGRRPFQGESDGALWGAIVGQPAPPLSELRRDVPEALAAVVARCLSKDPAQRYPDAAALARDLGLAVNSPGLTAAPRRVPVPLSSFVGRSAELEAIANLLGRTRLVTLTGPPGIGKTRLATEAAPAAARGAEVFFVALAALSDPALVIAEVATALGVAEDRSRSASEAVRSFLQNRRALVVLDNFEQVVAAAPVVAELLSACPDLRVLVTSRVPLRLNGEYEFSVPPLPLPAPGTVQSPEALSRYGATELFILRAQAVTPQFCASEDDAAAIAIICERLEGLPLAIELAAARIKLFPPRTLLGRLGNRLDLLKGGGTDRPMRHQTLRQAIDWSYGLLSAPEQRSFRRLGVLRGGFTLDAAEALCREPGVDPIETLGALVDQSLVRRLVTVGPEPRYQMLEMIREYALERLEEAREGEDARRTHEEHFRSLAERLESKLTGDAQRAALDQLEQEHDNLRAAFAGSISAGRIPEALRMGAALWRFWIARGHLREGRERLTALLGLPSAQPRTRERARVLHGAGTLIHEISDMTSARPLLEESLSIWRELGDARGTAGALGSIGWVALQQDEHQFGRACSQEAFDLSRRIADRRGEAVALNNLGWAAIYQGDFRTAGPLLEQSGLLREKLGDRRGTFYVRTNLAWVLARSGERSRAETLLDQALAGLRELGDTQLTAHALNVLGLLRIDQDDLERAILALEEGVAHWRSVSNQYGLAFGLRFLAEARVLLSQPHPADLLLDESDALWTTVGSRWGRAMVLRTRSRLRLLDGNPVLAQEAGKLGLAFVRDIGDRHGEAEALEIRARLASAEGQWEDAARDLGGSDGLREAAGTPCPPAVLRWLGPTVARGREALGPGRFDDLRSKAALFPPDKLLKDSGTTSSSEALPE